PVFLCASVCVDRSTGLDMATCLFLQLFLIERLLPWVTLLQLRTSFSAHRLVSVGGRACARERKVFLQSLRLCPSALRSAGPSGPVRAFRPASAARPRQPGGPSGPRTGFIDSETYRWPQR